MLLDDVGLLALNAYDDLNIEVRCDCSASEKGGEYDGTKDINGIVDVDEAGLGNVTGCDDGAM